MRAFRRHGVATLDHRVESHFERNGLSASRGADIRPDCVSRPVDCRRVLWVAVICFGVIAPTIGGRLAF